MPTLIDSLVVELGLDPSKFDAGQQKALNSLRKFEGEAGQTQKRIADSSAENLKFAFDALKNPFEAGKKLLFDYATGAEDASKRMVDATQGSQRGLKDLGVQASRTGQGVAKGAEEGALGMRGLAAGALMAVAAFTTLKGLLDYTAKATSDAAQAGYRAGWIGLPVEQTTAFSAAAYQKTGAPQEQTQSWMQQLQSAVTAFVTPGSGATGQPTGLIHQLQMMGIQPFHEGEDPGKALQETLQALETKFQSATDPQRAMLAGQLGMNPLLAEFMGLGPAAVDAATKAASLVATTKDEAAAAQALEQAERKVETRTDKLSRVLMNNLSPALTGFFNLLTKFEAGLPKLAHGEENLEKKHSWIAKILGGVYPGIRFGLNFLHLFNDKDDQSPDTKTAPSGAMPSANIAPASPSEAAMLGLISQREDPTQQNVYNYKHPLRPDYYTASGFWQITKSNWQAYAPLVGIDTKQYPEAISASRAMQQAVALYMLRQQGSAPWDIPHGGPMPVGSYPPAPPALPAPAKTGMNLQSLGSNLNAIKLAMASSHTTNTANTHTTNVQAPINVQMPAGAGNAHAGMAVAQEIRRQIIVTNSNSGFA